MHIEFLSLTKAQNVPLLSGEDTTALRRLQKQREHWVNRERQPVALRVAKERHAAFAAFLDNPSTETEQKLLVTADAVLTATRYATLRRACAVLRGRISDRALILDGACYTNLLGADGVAKRLRSAGVPAWHHGRSDPPSRRLRSARDRHPPRERRKAPRLRRAPGRYGRGAALPRSNR